MQFRVVGCRIPLISTEWFSYTQNACTLGLPELLSLLLDSSLRVKLRCAGSWLGEMGGLISLLEVFPVGQG